MKIISGKEQVKLATERVLKWPVKTIAKDLKYARDLSFHWFSLVGAGSEPQIRLSEKSLSANHVRPICFFCSYDKDSIVRENVFYFLDQLMAAGFDIVFISSSNAISASDLKKLSVRCVRIINRENRGYDFYGWKTGLVEYAEYDAHPGLLLANDSVLGPLFDASNLIARLEGCDADIVAMTDSFHIHPHLQSYFLYCKKNVVSSWEFRAFFREVTVLEPKTAVIRKYEVGFSRVLGRHFRLAALYDLEAILSRIGYHQRPIKWVEPTFHLWRQLVTEFKFPFLKKSVLTRRGVSREEFSSALADSGSCYSPATLDDWLLQD